MAEVHGNRTHLGPCRTHNGFEGRERHQATVHLRFNLDVRFFPLARYSGRGLG